MELIVEFLEPGNTQLRIRTIFCTSQPPGNGPPNPSLFIIAMVRIVRGNARRSHTPREIWGRCALSDIELCDPCARMWMMWILVRLHLYDYVSASLQISPAEETRMTLGADDSQQR